VSPASEAVAYLGLGSNLGDRRAWLRAALLAIDRANGVRVDWDSGVASLYRTSPVGMHPPQGEFFNSAVRVCVALPAVELLAVVLEIEAALGRQRDNQPSSRTVDIDLLLYGNEIVRTQALTVPHPRMTERPFVLVPLAEIAGSAVHPEQWTSIADLAAAARRRFPEQGVEKVEEASRWTAEVERTSRAGDRACSTPAVAQG